MRRTMLSIVVLLTLAACDGRSAGAAAPTTVTVTASPTSTTRTLADTAYLADLDGDTQLATYVAGNESRLVQFGHGICADYTRGVDGPTESDWIQQQLLADPAYQPELQGDPSVRKGTAAASSIGIDIAARRNFCPTLDPWSSAGPTG